MDRDTIDLTPSTLKSRDDAIDFSVSTEVVTLLIGDPATQFCVDPRLLVGSQYFQTALKQEWAEGQKRKIVISDIDAKLFNGYLNWLYSRNIFVDMPSTDWPIFVDYYLLGDRLMHTDFKDAVMDACCRFSWAHFLDCPLIVNKVYSETVPGAKLRDFVVDVYAQDKQKINEDDYPPSFLKDVCNKLMEQKSSDCVYINSAECIYHEHGKKLGCFRTRLL